MRYASTLDFSRVSAVASAVASAISACRPRRRVSGGVGERRSPALDLLRERAPPSTSLLRERALNRERAVLALH